jgi:hypothetical protein
MSIREVLLGSAAVLVAVTGARAADAIIVEPEPIEYVRVCDAYGSGWFYIPGTETCMKIDGDIRVDWSTYHYHDENYRDRDDETSNHEDRFRARFNIRANNETEYGTLESRIRFKAEYKDPRSTGTGGSHNDELSEAEGPSSPGVVVDYATIRLAGFYFGFYDNYWKRAGNDGWYTSLSRFEGPYGDFDALFFEYTYKVDGFAATIGMEDGSVSGEAGSPDPYAGVTYTNGGLYLAGIAYYDGSAEAGAYKFRGDYEFGSSWSGFKFGGWYMWDNGETDYVKGHALGLTAQVELGEKWMAFTGYGAYDDQYYDGVCTGSCVNGSYEQVEVGLEWNPVKNLFVIPEYMWTTYEEETSRQQNFGQFNLRLVRQF